MTVVVRYTVVDEVGEVAGCVVFVGDSHQVVQRVLDRDPVAHQRAMRLTGNHGRVDAVAGLKVSAGAVVDHRDRRPVGRVGVFRVRPRAVHPGCAAGHAAAAATRRE